MRFDLILENAIDLKYLNIELGLSSYNRRSKKRKTFQLPLQTLIVKCNTFEGSNLNLLEECLKDHAASSSFRSDIK